MTFDVKVSKSCSGHHNLYAVNVRGACPTIIFSCLFISFLCFVGGMLGFMMLGF
jgi:hypothetical protein